MTGSQSELTLMKKYSALLKDDWYDAYVIARRVKRGESLYEYFVHYDRLDVRLDQWLTRDSIKEIRIKRSLRSSTRKRNVRSRKVTAESDPVESLSDFENELTAHIKYVSEIEIGNYEIDTWHHSPYPGEFVSEPKLWICEYCFQYSKDDEDFKEHKAVCRKTRPPGKLVYCGDGLSIYEVDGNNRTYSQHLCLLGKLFIETKPVLCPTEKYLFYILCFESDNDARFIGYFSKEKKSKSRCTLNNMLVLPPYQQQGFGSLMISFSYYISVQTKTVGSPEKPLNDLGLITYRNYWSRTILKEFEQTMKNTDTKKNEISLKLTDLSLKTGIAKLDICETLEWMNVLSHWKNGENIIVINTPSIDECLKIFPLSKRPFKTEYVRWSPPAVK